MPNDDEAAKAAKPENDTSDEKSVRERFAGVSRQQAEASYSRLRKIDKKSAGLCPRVPVQSELSRLLPGKVKPSELASIIAAHTKGRAVRYTALYGEIFPGVDFSTRFLGVDETIVSALTALSADEVARVEEDLKKADARKKTEMLDAPVFEGILRAIASGEGALGGDLSSLSGAFPAARGGHVDFKAFINALKEIRGPDRPSSRPVSDEEAAGGEASVPHGVLCDLADSVMDTVLEADEAGRLDEVEAAFRFESDGAAGINADDFVTALAAIGVSASPAEARALHAMLDESGDGKISREEFENVLVNGRNALPNQARDAKSQSSVQESASVTGASGARVGSATEPKTRKIARGRPQADDSTVQEKAKADAGRDSGAGDFTPDAGTAATGSKPASPVSAAGTPSNGAESSATPRAARPSTVAAEKAPRTRPARQRQGAEGPTGKKRQQLKSGKEPPPATRSGANTKEGQRAKRTKVKLPDVASIRRPEKVPWEVVEALAGRLKQALGDLESRGQAAEAEEAFAGLDADGSGDISVDELLGALRALGVSATPDEAGALIAALDQDGDGRLDADEFIDFCTDGAAAVEGVRERKAVTLTPEEEEARKARQAHVEAMTNRARECARSVYAYALRRGGVEWQVFLEAADDKGRMSAVDIPSALRRCGVAAEPDGLGAVLALCGTYKGMRHAAAWSKSKGEETRKAAPTDPTRRTHRSRRKPESNMTMSRAEGQQLTVVAESVMEILARGVPEVDRRVAMAASTWVDSVPGFADAVRIGDHVSDGTGGGAVSVAVERLRAALLHAAPSSSPCRTWDAVYQHLWRAASSASRNRGSADATVTWRQLEASLIAVGVTRGASAARDIVAAVGSRPGGRARLSELRRGLAVAGLTGGDDDPWRDVPLPRSMLPAMDALSAGARTGLLRELHAFSIANSDAVGAVDTLFANAVDKEKQESGKQRPKHGKRKKSSKRKPSGKSRRRSNSSGSDAESAEEGEGRRGRAPEEGWISVVAAEECLVSALRGISPATAAAVVAACAEETTQAGTAGSSIRKSQRRLTSKPASDGDDTDEGVKADWVSAGMVVDVVEQAADVADSYPDDEPSHSQTDAARAREFRGNLFATLSRGPRVRASALAAMRDLDYDSSGALSAAEVAVALRGIGLRCDAGDVAAAAREGRLPVGVVRPDRLLHYEALLRVWSAEAVEEADGRGRVRREEEEVADWSAGSLKPPPGSVGEWLYRRASRVERDNFTELMRLLGRFERRAGLQQTRRAGAAEALHGAGVGDGAIRLNLGSALRCELRFYVG